MDISGIPHHRGPARLRHELDEMRRREEAGGQVRSASVRRRLRTATDAAATAQEVAAEAEAAAGAAAGEVVRIDEQLGEAALELGRIAGRVDNEIPQQIDAAAASPITDARLPEGGLTKWPFQPGTIPTGAIEPGAVGPDEIADFSLLARKFNTSQHIIY